MRDFERLAWQQDRHVPRNLSPSRNLLWPPIVAGLTLLLHASQSERSHLFAPGLWCRDDCERKGGEIVSYYAFGLTYADRMKATKAFRAKGGEIRSSSILAVLTPEISCPDWQWQWVNGYCHRGACGIFAMSIAGSGDGGHYRLFRNGKCVAIWKGSALIPSLYAARYAGAKLKNSTPLPLP